MEEEYYGFAVGLMVNIKLGHKLTLLASQKKKETQSKLEILRRHTEKHDMFTKDRINGYHGYWKFRADISMLLCELRVLVESSQLKLEH